MLEPYQYLPLGEGEIRIIRIKPLETEDGPLECTMLALESNRPASSGSKKWSQNYLALSYAWGPAFEDGSHLTHGVICDGKWLRVTEHLWRGLMRLRHLQSTQAPYEYEISSGKPKPVIDYAEAGLWIDAICINQNDTVEKSRQVQMMADIFSGAGTLIVWLGELDDRDVDEVRHIDELLETFCSEEDIWLPPEAVPALMERPWFARRWVCQEVATTWRRHASAIMMIGKHKIPLTKLAEALWGSSARLQHRDQVGICSAQDMVYMSLLQSLHRHDGAECSDEHDLVYALMHVCSDAKRFAITVDYHQSIEKIFSDIALEIVQRPTGDNESFALLALATAHPPASLELRSWIPNWRTPTTYLCPEHEYVITKLLSKPWKSFCPYYGRIEGSKFKVSTNGYLIIQGELCSWSDVIKLTSAQSITELVNLGSDPEPSLQLSSLLTLRSDTDLSVFRLGRLLGRPSPTLVLRQTSEIPGKPSNCVYRLVVFFWGTWKGPLEQIAVETDVYIG